MQRWVLLALVELLVIVLLAVQVCGAGAAASAPATPPHPAPSGASASEDVAAAGSDAPLASPSPNRAEPAADAASSAAATERRGAASTTGGARAPLPAEHLAGDSIGILLHGSVRSRYGGAVREPSVLVRDSLGKGRPATVSADGAWALCGLAPGEWSVTVRAEGFATLEAKTVLTAEAVQRLDLVLDPSWAVKVRIETPDGADANGEISRLLGLHFGLHVVGAKDPIPERLATTDYSTVFAGDAKRQRAERGKDGVAGTLELAAAPPAYVAALLRHVVLAQQHVEPGQNEVKLVVDPAEVVAKTSAAVRMRFVDEASGEPIANVHVELRTGSGGGARGKSDADGQVTIERALAGLLILEIGARDHEHATTTIRVPPGEPLDLGELRLGKQVALHGRIVDQDGKPTVGSVQWTELKWRRGPREFVHHRSASSDAEGKFQLAHVGPGSHALTARTPDGRVAQAVVAVPSPEPVVLRLAPPADVVFTRQPDPTQAYTVTLMDAQQRPVEAFRLEPRHVTFPRTLPPGEYGYQVHDDGDRLVRSGTLRLGGEPVRVSVP